MMDRVGSKLGNYQLIKRIGSGGYATVYLGEHVYLRTFSAIKIFNAPVSEEDTPDFLREARTIASLEHPHIIQVYDCGVERHIPFLVMKYAPGGTMRQRYAKGTKVSLRKVVYYIEQIAAALQYAHNNKVIHRDVKPENILHGDNDNVYLSDFGIALIAQTSQSTQDVVGTWAYMAPEQFLGKPRFASDQYSLAITAYEWICGERPFQGPSHELYAQHIYAPIPSLHAKMPELPKEIDTVLQKALSKQPEDRFDNVRSFASALMSVYENYADGTHIDHLPDMPLKRDNVRPTEKVTLDSLPPRQAQVMAPKQNGQPPKEEKPAYTARNEQEVDTDVEEERTVSYAIGKLIDFLMWFSVTIEVVMAIRFIFRLVGADPGNLFAGFIFSLSDIILVPFASIVPNAIRPPYQAFEWSTLIAMVIYWLVFWAIRRFLAILASEPEDEE